MLIFYVSTLHENFSLNMAYVSDSEVTKVLSAGTKVWQLYVDFINPERVKNLTYDSHVVWCANLYYSFHGHNG
jgi:uncharacterized protein YhbP (UPF0306 family)